MAVPPRYQAWTPATVLLEDPGAGMSEHDESTATSRTCLADRNEFIA